MMMKKNLFILIVIVIAAFAPKCMAVMPTADAMRQFRERRQDSSGVQDTYRKSTMNICPYFEPPVQARQSSNLIPYQASDSVSLNIKLCKDDQYIDSNGRCACKKPGHALDQSGLCQLQKTELTDPCENGQRCEVCQIKDDLEICKKCQIGIENCELCTKRQGQKDTCTVCTGRTCCSNQSGNNCILFPPEPEPVIVSPVPILDSYPQLISTEPHFKICYETTDISSLQLKIMPTGIDVNASALICKICNPDSPCKIDICQHDKCSPCESSQCKEPFRDYPPIDPCTPGKSCEVCSFSSHKRETCKKCQSFHGESICQLCQNGACEECSNGVCQICLKGIGCREFPEVAVNRPIDDPCLGGNCKLCIQRTGFSDNGALTVNEVCKECKNSVCSICTQGKCTACVKRLDGSENCPFIDPVLNAKVMPDPCEGGNCMVCKQEGASTVCKTCRNRQCKICVDGYCTACSANGSCLRCNSRGFCRKFPSNISPLVPNECAPGRPCVMCKEKNGSFECIKCNKQGKCCQTEGQSGECRQCGGYFGNRCQSTPVHSVCHEKRNCKDCYTNSRGAVLCRECKNGECYVLPNKKYNLKRHICGKYCMENFPEIHPELVSPKSKRDKSNFSNKTRKIMNLPLKYSWDPSHPVSSLNPKPENDPRYPYDSEFPEGVHNRAPYDPNSPYDPMQPEGPRNRKPYNPKYPWNPMMPESNHNRMPFNPKSPYDPKKPQSFYNRKPFDPRHPYDHSKAETIENRKPYDPREEITVPGQWNPALPVSAHNQRPVPDNLIPYDEKKPEGVFNRRPYHKEQIYNPQLPEVRSNRQPFDPRNQWDPMQPESTKNRMPYDPSNPYNASKPEDFYNRAPFNPEHPFDITKPESPQNHRPYDPIEHTSPEPRPLPTTPVSSIHNTTTPSPTSPNKTLKPHSHPPNHPIKIHRHHHDAKIVNPCSTGNCKLCVDVARGHMSDDLQQMSVKVDSRASMNTSVYVCGSCADNRCQACVHAPNDQHGKKLACKPCNRLNECLIHGRPFPPRLTANCDSLLDPHCKDVQPQDCYPTELNKFCVGTPQCKPLKANNYCGRLCVPSKTNNHCRGTQQCVATKENKYCDKPTERKCIPSKENNYCVGTKECYKTVTNNYCISKCNPAAENKFCKGTPECHPAPQNDFCKEKCIPIQENNFCRGKPECIPMESNNHCDKPNTEACVPNDGNNHCVGTPQCVSTPRNRECGKLKTCVPHNNNNNCRGRPECIPTRHNKYCDTEVHKKCVPTEQNSYCIGTSECVPAAKNNHCAPTAKCLPSSSNNFCRGTRDCVKRPENNYCDYQPARVCVPTLKNRNCVGTQECVPYTGNSNCKVKNPCKPLESNNMCRGTQNCIPEESNNFCDKIEPIQCNPSKDNNYCVGTVNCQPRPSNNHCNSILECHPDDSNNYCRGTLQCIPRKFNDYCDQTSIEKCVPSKENAYCIGTKECLPKTFNEMCGTSTKCKPFDHNNYCRGLPECVPMKQNNMCDQKNPKKCVPSAENVFCVGTPECKPSPLNNQCILKSSCSPDPEQNNNCQYHSNCIPTRENSMCLPFCVPNKQNNNCRGTLQCLPNANNEFCDELIAPNCKPSPENIFCIGTPECEPRAENQFCGKKCVPGQDNNFCRGTRDCVPMDSNDFCDRDRLECSPSQDNNFCEGKPSCVPHASNNFCRASVAVSRLSSECADGRINGELLVQVYEDGVMKGALQVSDVRKSLNCLIDGIKPDEVPLKLFCTHKAAIDKLASLKPHQTISNRTMPIDTRTIEDLIFIHNEGDIVDTPADLPHFDAVSQIDINHQTNFELILPPLA